MQKGIGVYLIMVLPPLFWAGNFVVGRAVSDTTGPLGLSFHRWLLALALLLPFFIKPLWQQRHLVKKHFLALTVLAVFGISGFNTFAYISLQYTTATNATLLNSFIPIFILIITGVFLKEPISRKQLLGVIVSLLGVVAIICRLDIHLLTQLSINKGDLWMLVAALDWALYSILLKYLRPSEISSTLFLGIITLIGTVALYPVYLLNPFNETAIHWDEDNVKALIYIAVFPSVLAYLAWNFGMKKLGAAKGGQFIHLMPFIGAILAILFLDESLELFHLVGGACIAMGLWLSLSKSN